MSSQAILILAVCTALGAGGVVSSAAAPGGKRIELPGQKPDGSIRLPNQWSLRPAGKQVVLGDFPVNIALDPSGRYAAVLHCGYGPHEIVVVDVEKARVVSRVGIHEAFYGLAFSPDGSRLYCSGAGDEVLHAFAFRGGYLSDPRDIRLRDAKERGVPCGFAVSSEGTSAWVANVWGQRLTEVALGAAGGVVRDYPLTGVLAKLPANLPAPPSDPNLAAAVKRKTARQEEVSPQDPFPYAIVWDRARQRLYVSLWGRAQVAVFDLPKRKVTALWPTQEHPTEMVLSPEGKTLYVANANRNSVSVLDAENGRTVETLTSSLHPKAPPGSTPCSLALSPDAKRLYVANACNNDVAVFDVSKPGRSRPLGFIPVGWYPTCVRVTPDGKHLLVANGKGILPKANPHGPQPSKKWNPPNSVREYIGGLLRGTLSIIPLGQGAGWERQLKRYTAQAYACTPAGAPERKAVRRPADNPIPARVGDPSPLRYCIYVVKENRTYDQVLGDLPQGNGESELCLFPERVTPNEHALAREFVLLDNFYVESEVSADGHEWTMGAYATDFVEKTWPLGYGHNGSGKFPYPSEGHFAIAFPSGGYLWDRAEQAGISYRSYGEFVDNAAKPGLPSTTRMKGLRGHFDPWFHGWDLNYPDVKRAARFIEELHRFEREGHMPRLQILRLPNDHTYGTSTGKLTPTAMVADNDLALGRVVEAVSRSKFWPQTAIFVVEDDAQNGPDHVDAHRTEAFAISPYTHHGKVDSTMYSTCSMLRTIELILGLRPMSQFDAAAVPMYPAFDSHPNLAPYQARPANVDLGARNQRTAWGRRQSDRMSFAKEDSADDIKLNAVIWHSVRGSASSVPAPVRAAYVLSSPRPKPDEAGE